MTERDRFSGDDYLWSGRGAPDPEIVRLERALSRFAFRADSNIAMRSRARVLRVRRPRASRVLGAAALAACLAIAAGIGALYYRLQWPTSRAWHVEAIAGTATIDGAPVVEDSRLHEGAVLRTGTGSAVRVGVARIGEVVVGQDSEVELIATQSGRHRLKLAHGLLKANIWAPPGSFGVQTDVADAADLGCEFVLSMSAEGTGSLRVTHGWVALSAAGRQSLIPEGAQADVDKASGLGTPYDGGASEALKSALKLIDAAGGHIARDDPAVAALASAARREDAITLISLLTRYPSLADSAIFDRAVEAVAPPEGLTREGIRRRDQAMLDAWWHKLPYARVKSWWMRWPDVLAPASESELRRDGLL